MRFAKLMPFVQIVPSSPFPQPTSKLNPPSHARHVPTVDVCLRLEAKFFPRLQSIAAYSSYYTPSPFSFPLSRARRNLPITSRHIPPISPNQMLVPNSHDENLFAPSPLTKLPLHSSYALPAPKPAPTKAGHARRLNRRTEKTTPKPTPILERTRREERQRSHCNAYQQSLPDR